MRTPVTLAALGLAALLLTACGKSPDTAPASATVTTGTGAPPSIPTDPSLPSVAEVASSAASGAPTPAREAGRTNATLTRSQEGSAMPLAGQNNDHSAPLASTEPASAPR